MASRNERRRKASQRAAHAASVSHSDQSSTDEHTSFMLGSVVKSKESQQLAPKHDLFTELYSADSAIEPPFPIDSLLTLWEVNPVHSGCIGAKVTDSVGRGWHLVPEDEDEEGAEENIKKLTRELTDKLRVMSPTMPFNALIRQWVKEADQTGQGYLEVGREGDDVVALFPVPPQSMRATKDPDVYVQKIGEKKVYFMRFAAGPDPKVRGKVDAQTGKKDWGDTPAVVADEDVANELIVMRYYSPRTAFYGIPEWISGVPAIAELTAIREFNVSFFESGGQADRLVHVKGPLEEAKKLGEAVGKQIDDSRGRAHLSLVTYGSEEVDIEVTPLAPADQKRDRQFSQGRDDLAKELLVAHQVPGYRIGWAILGGLGGEAAEEMLDSYRYGVVEPIQELAEGELHGTLFNEEKGGIGTPGFTFRFVELDWTSEKEKLDRAIALAGAGLGSPNDGRRIIGEAPSTDPRMDEVYFQGKPLGAGGAGAPADGSTHPQGVVGELRDAVRAVVDQAPPVEKSRWAILRRATQSPPAVVQEGSA